MHLLPVQMAVVHDFIALMILTPQVPHLIRRGCRQTVPAHILRIDVVGVREAASQACAQAFT